MSNYEFSVLHTNRLSVEASYSLNQTTLKYAIPVKAELGTVCIGTLDVMENITHQLGQRINKSQKSALTPEIKLTDKDRDATSNEIFRITGTFIRSTDPPSRDAAATMQLFLSPYKGLADRPLDMQTRLTDELLGKYEASAQLKEAAVILGLDKFFAALTKLNAEFATGYENRTEEHASQDSSASSTKAPANTAFVQFCNALEQAANFAPNNTTLALFNKIDEVRKIYHALEGGNNKSGKTDTDTTK